ncbi:hypothetical protein [Xanthocytophaga flava]|nr:hypothetical protein [Xanthocytophaga flavus]MDJ1473023.1 hypothetical protein [Xanthocytophaga flavus]
MKSILIFVCVIFLSLAAFGQQTKSVSDSIMITIFLKHQQDKNLDSLQAIQRKNKFAEQFPPKSARVISWYVMMGIGQVVTVKIPAHDLRTLNLSIERGAWGAFETEFYPTYDYVPIWKDAQKKK